MSIETAVLEHNTEKLDLVEINWPSGIVRMLGGAGIATALSQVWKSTDPTWGHILALSGRSEKSGEIANRDMTLRLTSAIRGELWFGAVRFSKVQIWEAQRNPVTGAIDVASDPWIGFMDMPVAKETLGASEVMITLVSNAARLREPDAGATTSTTSQDRFVSGDTAFDAISGPIRAPWGQSGVNPNGGYTGGGRGGDFGFDISDTAFYGI